MRKWSFIVFIMIAFVYNPCFAQTPIYQPQKHEARPVAETQMITAAIWVPMLVLPVLLTLYLFGRAKVADRQKVVEE